MTNYFQTISEKTHEKTHRAHELISANPSSAENIRKGGNYGLLAITQELITHLVLTFHLFMTSLKE